MTFRSGGPLGALFLPLALVASAAFAVPGNSAAVGAGRLMQQSSTRATSWSTAAARFRLVGDLATDTRGNVYVAAGCCTIDKLSSGGRVLARWPVGSSAHPASIMGIAVSAQGTIYGTDALGFHVDRLSASGRALAPWGHYGSGPGQFDTPQGIAVDTAGNVYVGDCGHIQKLSPSGKTLATWKIPGARNCAFGVAVDRQGNVYTATGPAVEKFSSSGKVLAVWGTGGTGSVRFLFSRWLAVDGQGNVYVSDTARVQGSHMFERVRKLSPTGKVLASWTRARDRSVVGIAVDRSGEVYLAEQANGGSLSTAHPSITKFSAAGNVLSAWT